MAIESVSLWSAVPDAVPDAVWDATMDEVRAETWDMVRTTVATVGNDVRAAVEDAIFEDMSNGD